jgi:single-strand DNA-binding protein
MNIVALVGNLATDPELRTTPGGKAVCTFRLAVSRAGGSEADFFTIVAWERQAEVCKEYLAIGRRIAVSGRLHHSSWDTEDGRRSRVEVIAHNVEMLGKPRRSDPTPDEHLEFAPTGEASPFDAPASSETESEVSVV